MAYHPSLFHVYLLMRSLGLDNASIDPTPRKALSIGSFVRWSRFLHHLTRTHTCEHVRQILGHTA